MLCRLPPPGANPSSYHDKKKNRKRYSFRQIPGSLSTHNADGNGDIKKAIGLITKRATLHLHHAFLYISRCSITT